MDRIAEEKACSTSSAPNKDSLAQMCCDGYVFYMSDGSRFRRVDVEPVRIDVSQSVGCRLLTSTSSVGVKRKRRCMENDKGWWSEEEEGDDDIFDFHMCDDDNYYYYTSQQKFVVSNECKNAWSRLSYTQKDALCKIQERVDEDRAENRYFTCVLIEGPGGCGKTRIMSHIMNHNQMNTLVLYVTKQNKRVQDFVHTDCLDGETDSTVRKPIDLTPKGIYEIRRIVQDCNSVGRYAVTAEKLVLALSGLGPESFDTKATVSSLKIDYDLFAVGREVRREPHMRNVVILLDEYTMLQPPLIHALAYYVRRDSRSPLLLVMGGDKLQCGPVGWEETDSPIHEKRFSGDIRRETVTKMKYEPSEIRMLRLQRCSGDRALADCVMRLRRVCEEADYDRYSRKLVNLVLARYSVDAGVSLYRKEGNGRTPDGACDIRKIVPADTEALDFGGKAGHVVSNTLVVVEENEDGGEYDAVEEELDSRGIEFEVCKDPPVCPKYDMCSLVEHFTTLFTKLGEVSFVADSSECTWPADIVYESVKSIRNLFPVILVLTNTSCNVFAERFLLALSTKVRERVLSDAETVPTSLSGAISCKDTWTEHLKRVLRRCIRCVTINEDDAIQRQTLFVGMVYKMTSTFKEGAGNSCCLCNGEKVVLTSIDFGTDTALVNMQAVTLRKLDREQDTDFRLRTGNNRNRMTNAKRMAVMPFVPYVSENIYQMQGNTMPKNTKTFVDLADVTCNSAYVAVSRFKNSKSIEGIVITE